jgi:hypothetical protein
MAATYFERARGSAEPFVTADPADRQWAENLARSLQSLGDVYQDLKQTTEAARAHEQARAILDRLEGAAERQQTPVDPHLQDFAIVIDMDVAGNPERQQMMEEADAPTVYGWLTDAGGGDVPVDRVVAATARGYDYLSALFGNLATEVGRVRPDREPAEINRRFYVYVAGAVSMTPSGDVLLLVDPGATESTHFNITDASRRFSATGAFEEVVVWVDGLRDRSTGSSFLVSPPTVPEPQARRWFTAISIRDSGPSKRARGPRLSHWILEGLRGAARDSSTGQVTSESLGQFIRSRMPAAEDRGRPTILVQGNIVFAGASGRAPAR